MKRRLISAPLILLTILFSSIAHGEPAVAKLPPDFYKFKSVYVNQIKLLGEKRDRDAEESVQKYIAALQALESSYQLSGELKPLLAVRAERTRFTSDPNARNIEVKDSPAMLGTLQQQHIDRSKEIQMVCSQGIIELSQHYKRRLTALQKDLTREGRIEEALAVLKKVDEIETSPEVTTATKQIASGGTTPVTTPQNVAQTKIIDMAALSAHFHGEVVGWNSITQEITIKYDFRQEKQLDDWEDAAIDPLRRRMVCDHRVAWFSPTFSSISRIDCDATIFSGDGPIRIMLEKSLYVELEPGTDGKARIYQGNPSYPIMKSHGGAQPYLKYVSSLSIGDDTVQWKMGSRSFPGSKLQQPIRPPIKIGFGHEESKTMFGNITVTGILSPEIIDSI